MFITDESQSYERNFVFVYPSQVSLTEKLYNRTVKETAFKQSLEAESN